MQSTVKMQSKVQSFKDPVSVDDGFVLIGGGTFPMGSPESENWRIDDETQHQVSVGPFYMDPYETTQKEYLRLMGENPSTFSRVKPLPKESKRTLPLFAVPQNESKPVNFVLRSIKNKSHHSKQRKTRKERGCCTAIFVHLQQPLLIVRLNNRTACSNVGSRAGDAGTAPYRRPRDC